MKSLPDLPVLRSCWKVVGFLRTGAARSSLWSTAEYGILAAGWLVATPFFVRYMGLAEFGVWAFLQTLVGSTSLLRFGFSEACTKSFAQHAAEGDHEKSAVVGRTTLAANAILGAVAAVLAASLLPTALSFFFPTDRPNGLEAALSLLPLVVVTRFLDDALTAILQGGHRFDRNAQINLPVTLTSVFGMVLVARFGGGLGGLVAVMFGGQLALVAAKLIATRPLLGHRWGVSLPAAARTLREMTSFGIVSWFHQVMTYICENLDRFIIARGLGPLGAAWYALSFQLASQQQIVPSRMGGFLFPKTAALLAQGQSTRLRDAFLRAQAVLTAVGTAIGLPLFLLSTPLLDKWAGVEAAQGAGGFLQLLALAFALGATSIAPFYFLRGAGLVRLNAAIGVGSSLGLIALMAVFVPTYGLTGAGCARIGIHGVAFVVFPVLFRRLFSESAIWSGLAFTLPATLPLLLAWPLTSRMPPEMPWMGLLASAAGLAVLGGVMSMASSLVCHRMLLPPPSSAPALR